MTIEKIDYIEQNKELITSLFNSPKFTALIESLLVPYQNLQDPLLWLADNLLNIDVAQGWHLDFIGMHPMVQQPRVLVNFNPNPYFGFKGLNGTEAYMSETFSSSSNLSLGGFWNSYTYIDSVGSRRLTDEEYRRVLKSRIVFNNSRGNINDILRVVNLITNNNVNVINIVEHRKLRLKYSDPTGLLDYFISRLDRADNIIPVSLGVTLEVVSFHSDELGDNTPTNPETPPTNPETPPTDLTLQATLKNTLISGESSPDANILADVDNSITANIRTDGAEIKGGAEPNSTIQVIIEE